jgi:NRAMP (natural resistance-associated macrophage protein)-like metal ion transporter
VKKLNRRGIFLFLAVMGPGIITAAADNDAGGITTYSVAGAKYGFHLLWVLLVITVVLVVVQEMSARMGAVTQKGLGELIREEFGVKWTLFALTALLVANLATTVAEFAGIAASLGMFGIPKFVSVPVAAIGIWFLVVKGSFRTVERVFLFFAVIFGSYVVAGIMAKPDWGHALGAMVRPSLPVKLDAGYLMLVIAVIGTTITPWMQYFLQATVVDKGIHIKDYKYQKWDVLIGAILTDFVSFFIIVAAAAALYNFKTGQGVDIKDATTAAVALKPLAGHYAELLFALGLFNASLLASAVVPLSTAYTYSEAFGWEVGVSRRWKEAPAFYGIYTLCIAFGSLVVLVPNERLIEMMVAAQSVSGILLPVVLFFMLKLINNKTIMGEYTNSRTYNILTWAMALGLIGLTVMWIVAKVLGLG